MGLALFLDRAEERESGWHRRLPRVRPGEQMCLLFFKVLEPTNYTAVEYGVFPHLLVRRPVRNRSWSSVTDRVLESSTRASSMYFAVVIRIWRNRTQKVRKSRQYNIDGTSITVQHAQETVDKVGDLQSII